MAKGEKKLLKYPKKPKAGASAQVLQNYIDRCKEVDKKNAERNRENSKRKELVKKVARIGKAK